MPGRGRRPGRRGGRRVNGEQFFHACLDAKPDDPAARLLLAEWHADRGDPRAIGYRWMAERGKFPEHDEHYSDRDYGGTWDWWSMLAGWSGSGGDMNLEHDRVPQPVMDSLDGYHHKSDWSSDCAYCEYRSRTEADDALARALPVAGVIR